MDDMIRDQPVAIALIVIWFFIVAIAVAMAADRQGKNALLWMMLSLLLSPLVALLPLG